MTFSTPASSRGARLPCPRASVEVSCTGRAPAAHLPRACQTGAQAVSSRAAPVSRIPRLPREISRTCRTPAKQARTCSLQYVPQCIPTCRAPAAAGRSTFLSTFLCARCAGKQRLWGIRSGWGRGRGCWSLMRGWCGWCWTKCEARVAVAASPLLGWGLPQKSISNPRLRGSEVCPHRTPRVEGATERE
jgi:hypothetical protein